MQLKGRCLMSDFKHLFAGAKIFAFVVCLCSASAGFAQESASERILSFHSDISINRDSTMSVTETIRVLCRGEVIKRGIYRDFPTTYRNRFGASHKVRFQIREVRRDGAPELYHIQELDNGVRVYIGRNDYYLAPGEYTYTLVYHTDRQIGFYKEFDELYWNVTGNGWIFPLDEVSASVYLPAGALREIRGMDGYTGVQGARGKDFEVSADISGRIMYKTTRPLARQEGFTVVVSWPKGYIVEPDLRAKAWYFLSDNRGAAVGGAGLVIILAYYLLVWFRFGRDPAKGPIIPLYAPPEKLSPADMRYIANMGYDNKVFTAAVLNMAVKKRLVIEESGGAFALRRTADQTAELSDEEAIIDRELFAAGDVIRLTSLQRTTIRRAVAGIKLALQNTYDKNYFLINRNYFIPGVVLSAIFVAAGSVLQSGGMFPVVLFLSVWLTGWTFGLATILMVAFNAWRACRVSGKKERPVIIGAAVFITFFCVPFVAGEIFGVTMLVQATSPVLIVVLAGAAFINVLFYHLLKARTFLGRKIMDRIEGFKMFLSVAERDNLRSVRQFERTPDLFERYLPYALALNVEQAWAEKFSGLLAQAQAGENRETGYRPSWYHGSAGTLMNTAGFVSALGSAFSGAVAASSASPGSGSGGGGGGSSGGGGGGGGGGGW